MRRPREARVTIDSIDERGLGRATVVRDDGRTVTLAVPGVLPGEVARVSFTRRRAGIYPAELHDIETPRYPRVEPFCRHFADCGGCTLQELPYPAQCELKYRSVLAAYAANGLTLLETPESGGSPDHQPTIHPILAAPEVTRYRNKLEYSCGSERWLPAAEVAAGKAVADRRGIGFHVAGRFDRIIDVRECHLQPEPTNLLREALRTITHRHALTLYDPREHTGALRQLFVRTTETNQTMAIVVFGEIDPPRRETVLSELSDAVPGLTTLAWAVNRSRNDDLLPLQVEIFRGPPAVEERCGHVRLRIRPKAFFQTNTRQAVELYRLIERLIGARAEDTLLDLYSGIGSIGLFLARAVRTLIGVERVADATAAAIENAELNGVTNATFRTAEVEDVLPELLATGTPPRLAVIDPPRAGLHPRVRAALIEAGPERLVYVSCNPRTQARDLADLADTYRLLEVHPVDMFPQTRHVESVALLERGALAARGSEADA